MASQPPVLTDDDIMRMRGQSAPAPTPSMQPSAPGFIPGSPDPRRGAQDAREAERLRLEQERLRLAREQANRPPQGYRPAAGGALEPIPGGPADTTRPQTSGRPGGQGGGQLPQAQIESLTDQFLHVADMYRRDFEPNDPIISLGWSPTERAFDRAAAGLTQQGFGAFRVPGTGAQSDRDAQMFAEANALSSTAYDSSNEEVLDNLQGQINRRRQIYGLEPVDWRQQLRAGAASNDPNQVQAGEGMGQVGNLPIVPGAGDGGHNELSNEGGNYVTADDRRLAGMITALANSALSADETIAQANNVLRAHGRNPLDAAGEASIRAARRNRTRHPGFSPTPSGRSDPNLVTGMANSPVGAGVIAAGDGLTAGFLDNLTSDPERTRAGMELLRERYPWETLGGEMAGSLIPGTQAERVASMGIRRLAGEANLAARGAGEAATIGEMAVRPAGNFIYGSAYGAGSADNGENRLLAGLRGGVNSLAGGEVGDRATAGVGRALTGTRNALARSLTERGVPLTIGDIASNGGIVGRSVSRVQNALESLPVLGDAIRARRADSREGFNRAAWDEALAPIGASTAGRTGETGAEIARAAVSDAYSSALDGVRVVSDAPFDTALSNIQRRAENLAPDLRAHFGRFVHNRVEPALRGGHLTGSAYQALRQDIRQELSAISGQLGERDYGVVLKRTEAALSGLLRRQSPETRRALRRADRAYRQTRVAEGAVGRAINNDTPGVFTPAQLGQEARQNANRYGGNAATTNRPFYELQREAQGVLPSTLPNSGTADRAWVLQAFPAIVSGAAYQAGLIDPKTAALFATLGLPYTRAGQRAFQKMLVSRPERVRRAGEAILSQRRWGGRAGAGAANPETDQTPPNDR